MLDENNRPYFSMLGAVADIQSKFDFYMEQIENSGDMDAAQALLLTFVRNYCRIVKRFNHKLEELPSFYLHEILKATPKDAIQDSAYVVLSPNKEMVNKTFSLPMGTRFVAGESTEGNTQYYSLVEKAYVLLSCTNINIYPYMIRDYLLICTIIIAIPPAITKIPIVKKNQKNHWA